MSDNQKDKKEEIQEEENVTSTEQSTEEVVKEQTPEEIIADLNLQIQEQKDKYLRLFADFDNYKKRNAKERLDLLKTAGKDIILSIIPTLDDLDRAITSSETATDVTSVRDGFVLVKNKLYNSLAQKGLKPMESINKEFNPDNHEAITKIPAPTAELKGKVVDEIEKGYFLNDKIIRYAKVVVGE